MEAANKKLRKSRGDLILRGERLYLACEPFSFFCKKLSTD